MRKMCSPTGRFKDNLFEATAKSFQSSDFVATVI
jgi:hypothetical protein